MITIGKYTLVYDSYHKLTGFRINGTPIREPLLSALKAEVCLDALTEEEIEGTIHMEVEELRRCIQQTEALLRHGVAA